jgi:cell division septation protein DedD
VKSPSLSPSIFDLIQPEARPSETPLQAAATGEPEKGALASTENLANLATAATGEIPPIEPPGGFEMVLGPTQIASLSFVMLVVLVLGCGVAYTVGRSTSRPSESASHAAPSGNTQAPAPTPAPVASTAPSPAAAQSIPAPLSGQDANAPLFGNPAKGGLYIQMSAIDRGMAIVFAEGLRKLGFNSLIVPGTNDHIFRVLAGPFPSSPEFAKAKAALTAIGLDTFGRRYDEVETKSASKASDSTQPTATHAPTQPPAADTPQPE